MVVSFSASMFKKALFIVLMVLMFVSVMSFTHNNSLKLQRERETLSEIAREVLGPVFCNAQMVCFLCQSPGISKNMSLITKRET